MIQEYFRGYYFGGSILGGVFQGGLFVGEYFGVGVFWGVGGGSFEWTLSGETVSEGD